MKRISFNPEINLGHVMTTAGFIGSLTVFGLTFAGDFKLIKADVQRHEATINRLTETESILARTQAELATRLTDHISQNQK